MTDIRNTITEESGAIDWINLINRQPTAYNPDKVFEQLKYQKSIWNHDEVADQKIVEAKQKAYDMAFKIVKGGGLNAN